MGPQLFGEPEMLGRILTNLVGNAVVVSDDRSRVRISLEEGLRHGTVRLSVTDSGPGMTPAQINELSRRGQSGTGSTGLGLAISRALAAQHFTRLAVRSQMGEGTRVALELAAAGPASVADAYARYRELVRVGESGGAVVRPRGAGQKRVEGVQATGGTPKRGGGASPKVRVDGLHRGVFKDELMLPLGVAAPRYPERVQVIQLRVVDQVAGQGLEVLDELIQREQRLHELVYRTHARRWVLFWDADEDMVAYRRRELERGLSEGVKESQLRWTEPQAFMVGDRTCAGLIRETLVRDTLHAHRRAPIVEDRPDNTESLRSPRAEERLEAELRRLGRLIRRQSERLQQQATMLDRLGDG